MQPCSGCGEMSENHPIVGVSRDQETGLMTAYPICYQCWVNPSHRTHNLKMHFFDKSQGDSAVQAAEDNILVEKPS